MKFAHSNIRVRDLEKSLHFFVDLLGLKQVMYREFPNAKYTLVYLAAKGGGPEIELTYNWEQNEDYRVGNSFGHLAFFVDDIYATCQRMMDEDIEIVRPPRDGLMAFVKTPDNISIEFLQTGGAKPAEEPWVSMPNIGTW